MDKIYSSVTTTTKIILKAYVHIVITYGINYVCTYAIMFTFDKTKRVPCVAHFEPMHKFPIKYPPGGYMGSPPVFTHVGPSTKWAPDKMPTWDCPCGS